MAGVFHAYDVRGVYGEDLDEDLAYKIGRALVIHTGARTIMVGRDMRNSSDPLEKELVRGITDQGADVVLIGLCSTPMFYWATREFKAGIMVTASHNPSKYNGFKICRDGARPVGLGSGLEKIERLVEENSFPDSGQGSVSRRDVLERFVEFSTGFLSTTKPYRIVVDAANGMGGHTYTALMDNCPTNIEIIPMYFDLDGNFPNHEANPLKVETLKALKERVLKERADFGVALDGDGDRVAFVDDEGMVVPSDMTTALIAKQVLQEHPGKPILFDIRSSRVVPEEIEAAGGRAIMTRVGHAFIKLDMVQHAGVFAGEVSGHYYNPEQQNTENTMLVLFRLMNLLDGRKLSDILRPLRRYAKIPETNFSVEDTEGTIRALKETYCELDGARVSDLDGVRIDFKDWWFNVRASNTEPLLRLNMEADSEDLLKEKLRDISGRIRSH